MPIETIYNFLAWDKLIGVPFPDEVKEIVAKTDWSKQFWQTQGLPIPDAKYSLVEGKTLYLDALPNGICKIEKQDYITGKVIAATYLFNDDVDGFNYFVMFLVTFVKGELLEVEFYRMDKFLVKDDNTAIQQNRERVFKTIKRQKSFWFKWLYLPWAYIVGYAGAAVLLLLWAIQGITVWITRKLTPF